VIEGIITKILFLFSLSLPIKKNGLKKICHSERCELFIRCDVQFNNRTQWFGYHGDSAAEFKSVDPWIGSFFDIFSIQ